MWLAIISSYIKPWWFWNTFVLLLNCYPSSTRSSIFLPVHNGFYPSKWHVDRSLHKSTTQYFWPQYLFHSISDMMTFKATNNPLDWECIMYPFEGLYKVTWPQHEYNQYLFTFTAIWFPLEISFSLRGRHLTTTRTLSASFTLFFDCKHTQSRSTSMVTCLCVFNLFLAILIWCHQVEFSFCNVCEMTWPTIVTRD